MPTVMGEQLKKLMQACAEALEDNPRTKPAPDCFFWPGVVFIALCLVLVVSKFISCYY